jgi:endonuclease/exonuclease/phosphatase family metal-dependent hydrolase
MLKFVSWNVAHRPQAWRTLADSDADVALLQEACSPPSDIALRFDVGDEPWRTEGAVVNRPWRAALVGLNSRVRLDRIRSHSIADAAPRDFAVSRLGTMAAAHLEDPDTREKYTIISMYAPWEHPHTSTESSWIYADASAHRLISDLSGLVGQERGHHVLAAGDLNILYGYGENGNQYWAARYRTIFDRFGMVGLYFVGPQSPNGRQADPWPTELPRESANVPTFHTNQQTPATATRQLDFVFASRDIAPIVKTCALNDPGVWGPSDHCRIRIDLG